MKRLLALLFYLDCNPVHFVEIGVGPPLPSLNSARGPVSRKNVIVNFDLFGILLFSYSVGLSFFDLFISRFEGLSFKKVFGKLY